MNPLDKFLDLILERLTSIDERLNKIEETAARHDENLKEHMKRSDLLEQNIKILETELENELKPVQTHIVYVSGFFKLVVFISILVGIYSALK